MRQVTDETRGEQTATARAGARTNRQRAERWRENRGGVNGEADDRWWQGSIIDTNRWSRVRPVTEKRAIGEREDRREKERIQTGLLRKSSSERTMMSGLR